MVVSHSCTSECTTVTLKDPNTGAILHLPCFNHSNCELTSIQPNQQQQAAVVC
jgi:hypothetical protein